MRREENKGGGAGRAAWTQAGSVLARHWSGPGILFLCAHTTGLGSGGRQWTPATSTVDMVEASAVPQAGVRREPA